MSRRVEPPSGWPPPDTAQLAGTTLDLHALAEHVAERYFERYPEDLDRYGDAARAWECHDTQHLLNWAVGDVEGWADLDAQVRWLAACSARAASRSTTSPATSSSPPTWSRSALPAAPPSRSACAPPRIGRIRPADRFETGSKPSPTARAAPGTSRSSR